MLIKNVKKSKVLLLIALIVLISSVVLLSSCSDVGNLAVSQVVLSFTEDSSTECSIRFKLEENTNQDAYVNCTKSGNSGFSKDVMKIKADKNKKDETRLYEVLISGLEPDTSYKYRIVQGNKFSRENTFTTSSMESKDFSFIYMGDSQENSSENSGYTEFGQLLRNAVNKNKPKFVVMGGDLINEGNDQEEWDEFFDETEGVFDKIQLMPAMGNHDDTKEFKFNFSLPKNGPKSEKEHFYSFDYNGVHFVVLDSNKMGAANEEDIQWLEDDLSNSDKQWKIAVFHHPPYVATSNAKDKNRAEILKEKWVPILEDNGVNLVLTGHQHTYMRTYPLYKDKICKDDINDNKGIVYLIGVSGSKKYSSENYDYISCVKDDISVYSTISVSQNKLSIVTEDTDGNVIDSFDIYNKNKK